MQCNIHKHIYLGDGYAHSVSFTVEKIKVECLNDSEEFPARQRNRKSKQVVQINIKCKNPPLENLATLCLCPSKFTVIM